MLKVEKKIIDFVEKNYKLLFFIFITIVALLVRIRMLNCVNGDYELFLKPWFDTLKNSGGFKGLATYQGDYNFPYMTIMALLTYLPINSLFSIKIVSILFDFALAVSCAFLASELVKKNKNVYFIITYSLVLFIPSVLLNSACWGQCDSIYATFVALSLLFLVKEKYKLSFIMLGLAFSFKLQFIFILPLYLVLYVVKKKFSIFNFLLIPLVDIIMCLPAMITGRPILECILVYFRQTKTYSAELVMNFPNIYQIFRGDPNVFYAVGELITIAICAIMLFYIIYKKVKFNKEKILLLGIWFITIVTFFLPGMHERYLYVGEVLSVLYFIIYKKNVFFALFINTCALITYSNFLIAMNFGHMRALAIAFLIVLYFYTRNVLNTLKDEKNFVRLEVNMKKVLNLYKKYEEIVNYLIVGVLTTVVSLVVKWGLLFTILDAKNALELQIAIVVSWIVAVIFAYITNRIFVFKSKSKNILKEITSFFGARVLTLVLEMGIMWFFVTLLKLNSDIWVLIWTIVSQGLVIIFNYILSKLFVFKKK